MVVFRIFLEELPEAVLESTGCRQTVSCEVGDQLQVGDAEELIDFCVPIPKDRTVWYELSLLDLMVPISTSFQYQWVCQKMDKIGGSKCLPEKEPEDMVEWRKSLFQRKDC